MQLNQYIAELLEKHDCVIIPDFGGFIGRYKSAEIDEDNGLIYPPSKELLFNPKLTANDGLLGHTIAQKEHLSYEDSLSSIQETIDQWNKTLQSGGRIELEKIGFLYQENDQYVFEQSREINLLLSAYGLAPVKILRKKDEREISASVLPTSQEEVADTVSQIVEVATSPKKEETIRPVIEIKAKEKKEAIITIVEPVAGEEVVERKKEKEQVVLMPPKKRKTWRYVAAAAILPFAFYAIWIPAKTDFLQTGTIQLSDLNPTAEQHSSTYKDRDAETYKSADSDFKEWDELTANLPQNVSIYNYQFSENLYVPIRLNRIPESTDILTVDESTAVKETSVEKEPIVPTKDNPYHLITGCFSVESNAHNLVAKLRENGFASARILDKNNGLWRVTAGDYSDRSNAGEAKSQLESSGYSNWILKQ